MKSFNDLLTLRGQLASLDPNSNKVRLLVKTRENDLVFKYFLAIFTKFRYLSTSDLFAKTCGAFRLNRFLKSRFLPMTLLFLRSKERRTIFQLLL